MGEIIMKCPLCHSQAVVKTDTIKSDKIEGSYLYRDIVLLKCKNCEHVFNHLTDKDKDNLAKYYTSEYRQNRFTPTEYNNPDYLQFPIENINKCIFSQNDIDNYTASLSHLNNNYWYNVLDAIIMDQFLEHCWDLDKIMYFIKKSLLHKGKIYVSVPDLDQYDTGTVPYMYLIKEHVQHFTEKTLIEWFEKNNFTVEKKSKGVIYSLNGKIKIPTIEFIFENNQKFFTDGIFCYGASREFLYLHKNNSYLSSLDITGIIDDTKDKEGKVIDGIQILDSYIIPSLSENSQIIITALYHEQEIIDKLQNSGYKGKITRISEKINEKS